MWAKRYATGLWMGQGLLEYALIMMLVALIVLVILAFLGPSVGNMFSNVVPRI